MNVVLWVLAGLLAAMFAMTGVMKLLRSKEQLVASGLGWAEDFSLGTIRFIGAAELLAAIGLILPPLVGVGEIFTPLAATGLVLMMIGAALAHRRRHETQMILVNLALLVIAAFVAVMRFGPQAF